MAWRYIAQRARTGQIIDLELPLNRTELRWELSGPGLLTGTLPPGYVNQKWIDGSYYLDEWGTYLYAEQDGLIKWGGIITSSRQEGGTWALTAQGFTCYPAGIPYLGSYYRQVGTSPLVIASAIWTYLQLQPGGNLGLTVVTNGATSARVGTLADPYELAPWEAPDCGSELAALASEAPFDFTEAHAWAPGQQTMTHTLTLWCPRAGRRRTDLLFNEDNLRAVVPFERDGVGNYANSIVVIGKGEGNKTLIKPQSIDDGRLRRVRVVTDKLASTEARCVAIARGELGRATMRSTVASITVADHQNAAIGTWLCGDDIPINVVTQQLGVVESWHRIIAWSLGDTDDQAVLNLLPSESFNYTYGDGVL